MLLRQEGEGASENFLPEPESMEIPLHPGYNLKYRKISGRFRRAGGMREALAGKEGSR